MGINWRQRITHVISVSSFLAWMWAFPLFGVLQALMPLGVSPLVWNLVFFLGLTASFIVASIWPNESLWCEMARKAPWASLGLSSLAWLFGVQGIGRIFADIIIPLALGFFTAAVLAQWGNRLTKVGLSEAGLYMSLMMSLAALLLAVSMMFYLFSANLAALCSLAFLALSGLSARFARAMPSHAVVVPPPETAMPQETRTFSFWLPFALTVLGFNLLSGIVHNSLFPLITLSSPSSQVLGPLFYGVAALAGGYVIYRRGKVETIAVIGLVLLGFSFVLIPFLATSQGMLILKILLESSYALVDLFIWCSIIRAANHFGGSGLHYFGRGLALNTFFIAAAVGGDSILKNSLRGYSDSNLALLGSAVLFASILPLVRLSTLYHRASTVAKTLPGGVEKKLTTREQEVLNYMLEGYDNNAIQHSLNIGKNTVKTHIRNVYSKLGVRNRTDLFRLYRR